MGYFHRCKIARRRARQGKTAIWLLSLFLFGCSVTDNGLSTLEIKQLGDVGHEVYGCTLNRHWLVAPIPIWATSTVWLIVPKDTPVAVNFTDCEMLKVR